MNGYLHASIAETVATDKIVSLGNIERNHISASSSSPIVQRMFSIACFVISLVHLEHTLLVPIVNKNWEREDENYLSGLQLRI